MKENAMLTKPKGSERLILEKSCSLLSEFLESKKDIKATTKNYWHPKFFEC